MKSILLERLKRKVEIWQREGMDEIRIVNHLKEELHYYVLEYVYTNSSYSHLIMYGGTAVKIMYGLPRMSEDLDFQTQRDFDIEMFSGDLKRYFEDQYSVEISFVGIRKREGIVTMQIIFPILKELDIVLSFPDIRIRFDVNYFLQAEEFHTELKLIAKDDLSFSIRTYTLSTLMASKVLAVLQRTERGIGKDTLPCKPRDIFDLLWYMGKKITPDMEYIQKRGADVQVQNITDLMRKVKLRVMNLDDSLFEKDLEQFMYSHSEFAMWMNNWKYRFQELAMQYRTYEIAGLDSIFITTDFMTDARKLYFTFYTKERELITFAITLSNLWFDFADVRISSGERIPEIETKIETRELGKLTEYDYEYAGLFYKKIMDFIKRHNNEVANDRFETKFIRATGDDIKPETQIWLDRDLLKDIRFEELL
jgi:hypothetical protein